MLNKYPLNLSHIYFYFHLKKPFPTWKEQCAWFMKEKYLITVFNSFITETTVLVKRETSKCVLFFIVLLFAWNVPLVFPIFLTRSLVFPFLLFSSISLPWSLRKAFLYFGILHSDACNWTWNNRLVPSRKRSTSRLYIVTLLIYLLCRVHHEKRWTGRSTSWNQDCQKYQ